MALAIEEIKALCARTSSLERGDPALLIYVTRLALAPRSMERRHIEALLATGFNDAEAAAIANLVACFSYMNRIADGLGVTTEVGRDPWARRLFSEQALERHLGWGARGAS